VAPPRGRDPKRQGRPKGGGPVPGTLSKVPSSSRRRLREGPSCGMRRKRPKATTRLGEHVEGSVRLPRKKPGGRMTYALALSPLKEHGQEEAKWR